jgi:hypothetical protein
MTRELISLNCVLDHLTPQDDAEAWKAILGVIGEEFVERYRADVHVKQSWFLRIGVCSHWWRPHQARWAQAGGFAWPVGYSGNLGKSRKILRQQTCRTASSGSGADGETKTGRCAHRVVDVSRTDLLWFPKHRRPMDLRCSIRRT